MLKIASNKNVISNHIDTFFEYATIGLLVTDISGEITDINPYALREFGYTKKELIGKKIEVLIPARFHDIHLHHYKRYIENPKTWPMGEGKEVFGIRKDGTEFSVEISLSNY